MAATWEPPLPQELQVLLPQYEITSIIGRGGMGAVYRGRQPRLDRDVAIKLLPEFLISDGDEMNYARRFEQEAQAMAKLSHPGIIAVYDFGETSAGQFYFVMEFIDGMDICQYLRQSGGKIPQEDALAIVAHVLDALGYAHRHGIIHRDIKPANVLIDREGVIKIADFGLAKRFDTGEAAGLTMSNVAVGTPDFVAPEALEIGKSVDQRADLYAVGVMLYQLLTGQIPRGGFKWPSELDPGIDPQIDSVVSKLIQSDPEARYSSAMEVRSAIDMVMGQQFAQIEVQEIPPTASVVSAVSSKTRQSKMPLFVSVGVGASLLLASIVIFTMRHRDPSRSAMGSPSPVQAVAATSPAPRTEPKPEQSGSKAKSSQSNSSTPKAAESSQKPQVTSSTPDLGNAIASPSSSGAGQPSGQTGGNLGGDDRAAALLFLRKKECRLKVEIGGSEADVSDATALPEKDFYVTGLFIRDKLAPEATVVSDEDLQRLRSFKKLRNLEITNTTVSDSGLAILPSLPELTNLKLSTNSNITGIGVAHLWEIKGLKELSLNDMKIGNPELQGLTNLDNLEKLDLSWMSYVNSEGILPILSIRNLKSLMIHDSPKIDKVFLERLHELTQLSLLHLSINQLIPELDFSQIRSLKDLGIYGTDTQRTLENSAALFAQIPQLEWVRYEVIDLTEENMIAMKSLIKLRSLFIGDVSFPNSGLSTLYSSNLSTVTVGRSSKLFDDSVLASMIPMKSLKYLIIGPGLPITDAGISAFRKARPEVSLAVK